MKNLNKIKFLFVVFLSFASSIYAGPPLPGGGVNPVGTPIDDYLPLLAVLGIGLVVWVLKHNMKDRVVK